MSGGTFRTYSPFTPINAGQELTPRQDDPQEVEDMPEDLLDERTLVRSPRPFEEVESTELEQVDEDESARISAALKKLKGRWGEPVAAILSAVPENEQVNRDRPYQYSFKPHPMMSNAEQLATWNALDDYEYAVRYPKIRRERWKRKYNELKAANRFERKKKMLAQRSAQRAIDEYMLEGLKDQRRTSDLDYVELMELMRKKHEAYQNRQPSGIKYYDNQIGKYISRMSTNKRHLWSKKGPTGQSKFAAMNKQARMRAYEEKSGKNFYRYPQYKNFKPPKNK